MTLKIDPLESMMIVGFHQLGCNISWIAKLTGFSRDRVRRQLQTLLHIPAENTGRPRKEDLSAEEREYVITLDAVGISAIDIAQTLDIGLPAVLDIIFQKEQKKRPCLRCDAPSPHWICDRCKRRRARIGAGLDDVYS